MSSALDADEFSALSKKIELSTFTKTRDGLLPGAIAVVRVKNGTTRFLSSVTIECAFLARSGEPIDVGTDFVRNLSPDQTGFAKVETYLKWTTDVACRVSIVRTGDPSII